MISPWWVPLTVKRLTTLSPSAVALSEDGTGIRRLDASG
jgi:hypothetical protein